MATAIYARYSTDEQRDTSIDDQIRRCQETAAKHGLTVDKNYIYADAAVSGAVKGIGKRVEFERLLKDIDSRKIQTVIFDDVSRAARNFLDGALLFTKTETHGLRVITCDGMDSKSANWDLMWSFKLITAQQQVKSTAHQVTRGMLGQLERGYQIAQPPYGYYAKIHRNAQDEPIGTTWHIHKENSEVVKKIYQMRKSGFSLSSIAYELNKENVSSPGTFRSRRRGENRYGIWLASTVSQLMRNQIYKGRFIWNGSSRSTKKARRTNTEIQTIAFDRQELSLVSEEDWSFCNRSTPVIRVRGGGKHALGGLMTCGNCHNLLSVNGGNGTTRGIYCPTCYIHHRAGGQREFVGYSSYKAAQLALRWVLERIFTQEVLDEFRQRIKLRLTSKTVDEEKAARLELTKAELAVTRIKTLIEDPEIDIHEVQAQLTRALNRKKELQLALDKIVSGSTYLTEEEVMKQTTVDPLPLLKILLEETTEPHRLRALLKRLLKRFELVQKIGRFTSIFEIEFIPGVAVADVSETKVIDETSVGFQVQVTVSSKRPTTWLVDGKKL